MRMSKLNKKWWDKENSFKLSVFKKRILKTGAEDIIKKYNDINDSNKKDVLVVTTSTMMTTTMTAMKVAATMAMMTAIMMIYQS